MEMRLNRGTDHEAAIQQQLHGVQDGKTESFIADSSRGITVQTMHQCRRDDLEDTSNHPLL